MRNNPQTGRGDWVLDAGNSGYITDAPSDGNTYGRKDGAWAQGAAGEMVYPGAGIGVSTGSAWGTSITDKSTAWNSKILIFTIDGRGAVIEANASGSQVVPYDCNISKWELTSTASGSMVVDVLTSTYSSYPTFASIAASAKPTLTTAVKSTDSTLTGWTKTLSAGDRVQVKVDSSDITGVVVLTLYLQT